MSDDIEKKKTKAELENLGRLVDQYAQSRSLGLLIPLAIIVINSILLIGSIELAMWKPEARWTSYIAWLVMAWVVASVWVTYKLVSKYGSRFYRKDGKIELKSEKTPFWACVVFFVSFLGATILGATILGAEKIVSLRWTLTLLLASAGIFVLYIRNKEKEKLLCIVWGSLLLLEAIVIAAGVPTPFAGKGFLYSFLAGANIYVVGAGILAAVVVHIYNRKILRKIKEMRPFGEQESNKSDS